MSHSKSFGLAIAMVVALGAGVEPASAGTITGTITASAGGAPIGSAEVRVWIEGIKGWSILATTAANGSGVYSHTVAAGEYLIDVRGPAGSGLNYGDRWYDVVAPLGSGYIGEVADPITVGAAQTVSNVNVALEILGGTDGLVFRAGGIAVASMAVRMERRGEVRIHHNDTTKALTLGLVSMRGMVPETDYQIMIYDPAGVRDTTLFGGPYTITSNVNGNLGNLTMVDYAADPYENNNAASCSTVSVNSAALHMTPPQPWVSAGSRIGPLASGDVDWFCYTANEGDRLFVTASTAFTFSGATRYSPWTDPLLSFWRGARVTRLAEDDDSGPGGFDSMLDTGPLTAGCHCAAVTTFGDLNYVGAGQTSTGKYSLRFEMGNRPPVLIMRKGATNVPVPPAVLTMNEDDTLALTLGYADADGDAVVRSFTHVDNAAVAVAGGTLNLGVSGGDYTWTPGPLASAGSPYVMTLQGADGEFAMTRTLLVVVEAVNHAPAAPVLVSPIGDTVVMTMSPALVWQNAADPDGNPVSYDVEVYYDDPNSAAAQVASVGEGGGGMSSWNPPAPIPENTRVFWRVRSFDGFGGISPWSGFGQFLVDLANEAPEIPILIKPSEGELLFVRRPGLSVLNVEDAEDDDVTFTFEIALDADFTATSVVWTSTPIAQNTLSATTMAVTDTDLDWGEQYYARVRAVDDRGGISEWSDWHSFRTKENLPPGTPGFAPACEATVYTDAAPTEIVVSNVNDPEAESVVFQLEMFDFDADPSTATPVYTTEIRMDPDVDPTEIPIDLSELPNGHYRYRVRAFDGTDFSDWIECELTLDVPDPPGTPGGGCCSTSTDPFGAGLLALLAAIGLGRRRRRRA